MDLHRVEVAGMAASAAESIPLGVLAGGMDEKRHFSPCAAPLSQELRFHASKRTIMLRNRLAEKD